ncbi:MAG: hypothetical protein AAF710_05300 [Planctomycetota bacterium]
MSTSVMAQILVFGGLAFTLVTLVLYTLAHQMGSALQRHELIRRARQQQVDYLRSVAERRRDANADYGPPADAGPYNVDVLDEPEAPAAKAA